MVLEALHDSLMEDYPDDPARAQSLFREAQREMARTNLFYLITYVLHYRDVNIGFHLPLCNSIEQFRDMEQLHLHPRGHFKSTVITIGETIQDILRNPNIRILVVNAVVPKAKAFLREIVQHFTKNPTLGELFPEHIPSKRAEEGTKEEFSTPARTRFQLREHTVEVAGIEKAVVSAHYDKIVFDDIVNGLNCNTKDFRDKIERAYAEYLSLLDPPGCVRIIGTRWHYDDLYGRLLERLDDPDEQDTLAEESDGIKIFRTSAYLKDGNVLFPERFTPKYLRKLEKKQGKRIHSAQYRNQPIADEDRIFDSSDLRYANKASPAFSFSSKVRLPAFSSCDPALSEKERDDPTAIVTILVDHDSNIYIKDAEIGMWNPGEVIDHCLATQARYAPQKFGFEAVGFQRALQFFLELKAKEEKQYLPIETIRRNTHTHKETRLQRIQPFLSQCKLWVIVPDEGPEPSWVEILKTQLDEFPYSKHDDLLDALADCIEIMSVPSKQRKKKYEYSKRGAYEGPYHTGRGYRRRRVR